MAEPVLSRRFEDALVYAAQLHRDQLRKGTNIPYIAHLLAVTSIAVEHGADEDEAIGALLHDAAEDQGGMATLATIRERFGARIADIVEGCTDAVTIPKPPWRQRKEAYVAHLPMASASVRLVSASDKLHNARSILSDLYRDGEKTWARFNGDKEGTLWYYRALVNAFRTVCSSPLVEELDRVVTAMEQFKTKPNAPQAFVDSADQFRDVPSLEDLGYIENPHGGPPVMLRTKEDFDYCRKHGIKIPDDWKPPPEEKEQTHPFGCPRCLATPNRFDDLPFELVAGIVDHSHESVDLMRCKYCGQLFADYWIEILLDDDDDMWSYWVPITAAEAEALQAPGGASKIISLIKSRRRLVCGPSGKFRWNEGDFEIGIDLTPPG